jgi:hypothetical protein
MAGLYGDEKITYPSSLKYAHRCDSLIRKHQLPKMRMIIPTFVSPCTDLICCMMITFEYLSLIRKLIFVNSTTLAKEAYLYGFISLFNHTVFLFVIGVGTLNALL